MSIPTSSLNVRAIIPSSEEVVTFMKAAAKGELDPVLQLLDTYGDSLVNERDPRDSTALLMAAWQGHAHIVAALLERHADIEAKGSDGTTALIWAAWGGYLDVVTILLEHKADITAVDNDAMTALAWAIENGHADIQEILRQWPEKQRQRADKLAMEMTHSGISQAVQATPRLALRPPQISKI